MQQQLESVNIGRLPYDDLADLAAQTLTVLGSLPPAMSENASTLQLYTEQLAEARAAFMAGRQSEQVDNQTQEARDADRTRDRAFSTVNHQIKAFEHSDDQAEFEAAYQLGLLMNRYKGTPRLNDSKETAALELLIADLQGPLYSKYIDTLGVKRFVDRLQVANNAFKAVVASQNGSAALQVATDNKLLHQDLVARYTSLCRFVETMANVPNNGYFVQLLAGINTVRKDFAVLQARRAGIKESKAAKEAAKQQVSNN